MNSTDREYAYCPACGNVIYRIPGHRHGDGQVDTEQKPVWLLEGGIEEVRESLKLERGLDVNTLPEAFCGCTD